MLKSSPIFVVIAALAASLMVMAPAQATTVTYSGYTLDEARNVILAATNQVRADAGLPPLRMTTRLNNVAQNWSGYMASQQYMAHNPNYSNQYPSGWGAAGENVAAGYTVDGVTPAWRASSGHYANMVYTAFNYIGIGIARDANGRLYYTQNFAYYASTPTDVIGGTTPNPSPSPTTPTPTPTPSPSSPTPTPTPTTPTPSPSPSVPSPPPVITEPPVTAPPTVSRVSGSDRFATAVAVSSNFRANVPVVYVANGSNFPDALSAAPAAAYLGGPLLLTPANSMPATVLAEIRRLNPQQIVVVGGESVVSNNVYNQLRTIQPNIRRDAGQDRFETSRIISQNAFGRINEVYIATGSNFPDALSGSASAGAQGIPVILVPSTSSSSPLPASTREWLITLGVDRATLLGGPGVVSTRIESDLRTLLGSSNVTRLSGTDRYGTSSAINRASFTTANEAFLAVGTNFADALSGAALAGARNAPLFLVQSNCIPSAILTDLNNMGVSKITLLGGPGVLSSNVAALRSC